MTQLVHEDSEAFLRYGIAQSTAGSVSEDLAERMVERFPEVALDDAGWEAITAEDERFGDVLRGLDLPLLLAKHDGCLMSTDEGFEDARKALPGARAISVPAAPCDQRGLRRRRARVLRGGQRPAGDGTCSAASTRSATASPVKPTSSRRSAGLPWVT